MPTATQEKGIDQDLETLKSDLVSVKSDLKSLYDTLMGTARSETGDMADAARKNLRKKVNTIEGQIEENPFTTVLVALGVGIIVGKILGR